MALSIYSAMSDYSKLRSYHTTYTTVNYIFIPLLIFLPACNSNERINDLLCRAEYHYNTLGADAAIATVREIDNKHEYVIDSNVARFLLLWGEKEQRIEDFDHANFILNSMKSLPDDPDKISARYISDAGLFPLCGYQLRYS
ncbi:hypothetical protein [Oceanimonas sp. CAM02]|uniref:hypothetical protein n=1 Tax=Oceanimonas sp. CAM02 TaxID=3080336 RepID=UPI002935D39B|nr:hypothetical protein [Oceanimonas sp. CAM02]MDV2856875.1 hypothetical protein [Oceanimonas sp. CAM02]